MTEYQEKPPHTDTHESHKESEAIDALRGQAKGMGAVELAQTVELFLKHEDPVAALSVLREVALEKCHVAYRAVDDEASRDFSTVAAYANWKSMSLIDTKSSHIEMPEDVERRFRELTQ